jgi:hypothetical protein
MEEDHRQSASASEHSGLALGTTHIACYRCLHNHMIYGLPPSTIMGLNSEAHERTMTRFCAPALEVPKLFGVGTKLLIQILLLRRFALNNTTTHKHARKPCTLFNNWAVGHVEECTNHVWKPLARNSNRVKYLVLERPFAAELPFSRT